MKDLRHFTEEDFKEFIKDDDYNKLALIFDKQLKDERTKDTCMDDDYEIEELSQEENDNMFELSEENKGFLKHIKKKCKKIRIENNKLLLKCVDDINKKHTVESRKKLSDARRSRTKQPRDGTSKKAKNFYEQLLKEYGGKNLPKKYSNDVSEFLENNKDKIDISKDLMSDMGIITDYKQQSYSFSEIGVDEVLFDLSDKTPLSFETNIDINLDETLFEKHLKEELNEWLSDGKNENFLKAFESFKRYQFEIEKLHLSDDKESNRHLREWCNKELPEYVDWFM